MSESSFSDPGEEQWYEYKSLGKLTLAKFQLPLVRVHDLSKVSIYHFIATTKHTTPTSTSMRQQKMAPIATLSNRVGCVAFTIIDNAARQRDMKRPMMDRPIPIKVAVPGELTMPMARSAMKKAAMLRA